MRYVGVVLTGMWMASTAVADAFDLRELPRGRSVTLPHPAVTHVPLTQEVRLTSTDAPQTLKLSAIGPSTPRLNVAIFDSHSERVKYVTVTQSPMLYVFKSLKSIQVVPKLHGRQSAQNVMLRIESNKPLGISR